MAVDGELSGLGGVTCSDCGTDLPLQVCHSAAGYYLGYWCPNCGPYSRETGYYGSREQADEALERLRDDGEEPPNLRDTEFRPAPFDVREIRSASELMAHFIQADAPQVGPVIPVGRGVSAVVSPGTGPCPGATEANAVANIVQLIKDAGLDPDEVQVVRDVEEDEDGRYGFTLSLGKYTSQVDMPGWPLEQVRWLDREDQNIWDFPRLYVDGGSWVWKYAMGFVGQDLRGESEEEGDD